MILKEITITKGLSMKKGNDLFTAKVAMTATVTSEDFEDAQGELRARTQVTLEDIMGDLLENNEV